LIDFCKYLPVESTQFKAIIATDTTYFKHSVVPNTNLSHTFFADPENFKYTLMAAYEKKQLNRVTPYELNPVLNFVIKKILKCKEELGLSEFQTALLLAPPFAHYKTEQAYPTQYALDNGVPKEIIDRTTTLVDSELKYLQKTSPESFDLSYTYDDPNDYLQCLRCAEEHNKLHSIFRPNPESHILSITAIASWIDDDTQKWTPAHFDQIVTIIRDEYPSLEPKVQSKFKTDLRSDLSKYPFLLTKLSVLVSTPEDPKEYLADLIRDSRYDKNRALRFLKRLKEGERCIDSCITMIEKTKSSLKTTYKTRLLELSNEVRNAKKSVLPTSNNTIPFTDEELNNFEIEPTTTKTKSHKKNKKRDKQRVSLPNQCTSVSNETTVNQFESEQAIQQEQLNFEWATDVTDPIIVKSAKQTLSNKDPHNQNYPIQSQTSNTKDNYIAIPKEYWSSTSNLLKFFIISNHESSAITTISRIKNKEECLKECIKSIDLNWAIKYNDYILYLKRIYSLSARSGISVESLQLKDKVSRQPDLLYFYTITNNLQGALKELKKVENKTTLIDECIDSVKNSTTLTKEDLSICLKRIEIIKSYMQTDPKLEDNKVEDYIEKSPY
jgi:hypothetical protein